MLHHNCTYIRKDRQTDLETERETNKAVKREDRQTDGRMCKLIGSTYTGGIIYDDEAVVTALPVVNNHG